MGEYKLVQPWKAIWQCLLAKFFVTCPLEAPACQSWFFVVFVIEKCSQAISQTGFLSEALDPLPSSRRIQFLEAVRLRPQFSCWWSARGYSQFWKAPTVPCHTPLCHHAFFKASKQENLSLQENLLRWSLTLCIQGSDHPIRQKWIISRKLYSLV